MEMTITDKLRNAVTDPRILLRAAAEQARLDMGGYAGPITLKISQRDLDEYRRLGISAGATSVALGPSISAIETGDENESPVFAADVGDKIAAPRETRNLFAALAAEIGAAAEKRAAALSAYIKSVAAMYRAQLRVELAELERVLADRAGRRN